VRIVNHLHSSGDAINLVRPTEIKKKDATKAETVSCMAEYADMKDAAAQHSLMEDEMRYDVFAPRTITNSASSRNLMRTAGGQISVERMRLHFRCD
jgi:hypothetical protein